jgi:hypothetical protein
MLWTGRIGLPAEISDDVDDLFLGSTWMRPTQPQLQHVFEIKSSKAFDLKHSLRHSSRYLDALERVGPYAAPVW